MRIKNISKAVIIVLTVLFCASVLNASTFFQIGKPDGSPKKFGLANSSYKYYGLRFTKPVIFTVNKDPLSSWPFIHPSTLDPWAGEKAHTFTINFTLDSAPQKDTYLHIGLADVWRHSEFKPTINETSLGSQKSPPGSGRNTMAFDPLSEGKVSSLTFKVPKASLKTGPNKLTLTLDNGSWIIYDHVTLDDSPNPPKLAQRQPAAINPEYLENGTIKFDEIVFAARPLGSDGHWYANFSYYAQDENRKAYRHSSKLCKMNIRNGKTTVLLDDPKGSIRDPQVHYDGKKIIFAYRKADTDNFNLYEIDTDGNNLTQVTYGKYDDIEPTYMPDDSIIFASSRCKRWVNCWLTQVAVLYRCDSDGSNVTQLSSNNEHENTPWPLPDGRILYQRWEYVDRSQVHYHHLWTTNPDGTNQSVFYGNLKPGIVMIDAKPIPDSEKILTVFSWGHGAKEHVGDIAILTPKSGPDHEQSAKVISKGGGFRDPYPIADNCFLVARGQEMFIMKPDTKLEKIYRLPGQFNAAKYELHEPRPIIARKRECVIPSRVDETKTTGSLILVDVYKGRNMQGVKKGDIKELLVLETLPKPINYTGGMDPLTYGGSFTLERVLGTIPVEQDGSAYMELPADRGLFFVALDKNGKSVKRMQSFLTVKPGETTSCLGCHEQRTKSGTNINTSALMALDRQPSKIKPVPDVPDVIDFPRDIQPILDKHCVTCHGYEKNGKHGPMAAGIILAGDHGPMFSHSYVNLTIHQQVADGRNQPKSNYPPYALGSSASPLMHKIEKHHNGVKLTKKEKNTVRLWIEVGAPYPGTYAALGAGMIGGYAENTQIHTDFDWHSRKNFVEAINKRCASCHKDSKQLPLALSDENKFSFWQINSADPRMRYIRHLLFNLSRPQKSLMLLAPLAKEAGGFGMCRPADQSPVFASTDDPDYQAILKLCTDGKDYLAKIKRFDMPGFIPPRPYIREMKRYGVLPADLPENTVIDFYKTDQSYWRSLWYQPVGK